MPSIITKLSHIRQIPCKKSSDTSGGPSSLVLVILKHLPSLSLQPLVLLQTNPNHQQEHSHQNTHDSRTHPHVLFPCVFLLTHLQTHPPRLLTSLTLQLQSLPFLLFLRTILQIATIPVQKYSELFTYRLVATDLKFGWHLAQTIFAQHSSFYSVQQVFIRVLGIPHKGKRLQTRQHYLALCFESVDFIVVVIVPESMDTFIGVGDEVLRTHMQIVKVVPFKNWFSLPITVLFAFTVPFPKRFHNGGMSLILTQQNDMLPLNAVE